MPPGDSLQRAHHLLGCRSGADRSARRRVGFVPDRDDGLTIHLRQQDLAPVAPPGPGIEWQPATGVFHWPMYATTAYGGGALWLANQVGIVACLDPQTGEVRASERVRQSQLIYRVLAVDPVLHAIYALDTSGLLQITPPRRC